eukprot:CAMPEP_0119329552 /NCGR_PEP_ID=MMETSP1333-20130426/76144_1 /TAXON_ID=418940 /ORGANISM="Scyphosphaera apsteinii, Strain RCC1455" /LENGTH=192 /DNA_ID=CAMNT_0007338703 /DNA_START=151 /DNA_END=729 /DNA_ORIENTATION=+
MVSCILLVVVWILSFVPLTPLELSIGYLFGFKTAYACVYAGKVIGCSTAFILGRSVAYNWAQRQFGQNELLRALDKAVSERPLQICVLVRFGAIPIAIKNYGLAILTVTTKDFIRSLVVVESLMSTVLVFVGSTAKNLEAIMSGRQPRSAWQAAVVLLGCCMLLALVAYVSLYTRRALREIRKAPQSDKKIQ